MIKQEAYEELHELKKSKEVQRYLELLGEIRKSGDIKANHIKCMGFSPEFTKAATILGYETFGELTSTPTRVIIQEFGKTYAEELVSKMVSLGVAASA